MTQREIAIHVIGFQWRMEVEDWRIARIVAAVYDVNRNPKKRKKPITAQDFMPKKPGAKTPDEQFRKLRALTLAMGGEIRQTSLPRSLQRPH